MLPKADKIEERILQGFDRSYYDGLYKQMCYAFGEKWNTGAMYIGGGSYPDIPIYQDVKTRTLKIGESRRIFNTAIRSLSKTLSKPPLPSFPQVDEVTEEVRRQFWLANANGNRGIPTKWLKQLQYAFGEGDTIGVGAIKHGLRSVPGTGFQVVDMKHVPALQVIWDPFESDPRNSKWVAVVSYVPYDIAASRFGKKKADDNKRTWTVAEHTRNAEFVRIVEYWDVGYGGDDPAYCEFLGEITDGKVSTNELGFIPVSFCVGYVAPGMRRPVGRVMLQMSTQEGLNDAESYMRKTMQRGPAVDVFNTSAFDPESLARWKAGDTSQGLETSESYSEDDIKKLFNRVPGMEVPQGVMAMFGVFSQQYNDDANQTEQARGNALGSRTTASEVQNLQARAQEAAGLTDQQATEFLQDSVSNTMKAGMAGDTLPVPLDIFGRNITFNDPKEPGSFIQEWLTEPSAIVIDIEATTKGDEQMKAQMKQQELLGLQALLGVTVDPMKYTSAWLDTMNIRDKEAWLMQQPAQPAQE